MFTRKPSEPTRLEEVIDILLLQMSNADPATKQYAEMADQLTKLYKLKEINAPKQVSPDTLALIAGNLLGIAIIIGHERVNVIASKAIGFVTKLK